MNRKLACLVACALATTALPALAIAAPATAYKAPRNGLGQPDFGGVWTNTTMTRMERPNEFGTRKTMTVEEATKIEKQRQAFIAKGKEPTPVNATTEEVNKACDIPGFPATADCAYNVAWTDGGDTIMRVNGEPRTSLVTFPANGKIPYKTVVRGGAFGAGKADNPEDRILPERCLVSQNVTTGALLNPTLYNNNYLIQQGRDSVAIVIEMAHDVRNIRLNAKHDGVPKWFGDSVGHWEGDTLVVDTIDFNPAQLTRNTKQLHIVERFTRVAKDKLLYQFRVEDPGLYSEAWGGEYEFTAEGVPQYEYACHEGNYGLLGILEGARADDKLGKVRANEEIAGE